MMYDVVVVGAGAAGLIAAGKAAEAGARTLLLEKNEKVGRKIGITGKGRCNVTNACDQRAFMENIVTNARFLYSACAHFTAQDTMQLLEAHRVPLKIERGQRVFPVSDRAFDIIDGLLRYVKKAGAVLRTQQPVQRIRRQQQGFIVQTSSAAFETRAVVLCTGGLSYSSTGSSGDGHCMAAGLGLELVPGVPGLIPLTVKESWCRDLMGVSLKNAAIRITQGPEGKVVYEDFGEMLFTHFGVSGPIVLSASSRVQAYLRKKKQTFEEAELWLHIDLKSALTAQELDQRLLRDFEKYRTRNFQNALTDLLPRKMIPVMVKLSGIEAAQKVSDLTREQRQTLGRLLKDLRLSISGTRPLEEAIVTMGGIAVQELAPATMMVKKLPGLFAAGELLDVDALTGGFNLQLAFSTGAAAGIGAAEFAREKERKYAECGD